MKQKSKCERPEETKANKPWTKINLKAQEKYPVSRNILKSLTRFYIVIHKHQVMQPAPDEAFRGLDFSRAPCFQ